MLRALVAAVVLGAVAVADAQAPNPEGAKLFEEGRVLAKDGKFAEACDKFAKSLELDPAIGTQLNYADCNEQLGRHAEAWRLFDGAADAEKMTNPERAKFARARADALLPKVGVIVLKVATPSAQGLAISIGGRAVKAAAVVREIVAPGSVEVTVSAAQGSPFEDTKDVGAGETVTLEVPAFPEGRTDTGIIAPGTTETTRRRPLFVRLAVGVGAAGVLSVTGGILLGLKAKSDYEEQFSSGACQDVSPNPICTLDGYKAQNSALTLANIGTVVGIGGIALMAGGAVLFLAAPRDVVVSPTVTGGSPGLTVVGKF